METSESKRRSRGMIKGKSRTQAVELCIINGSGERKEAESEHSFLFLSDDHEEKR